MIAVRWKKSVQLLAHHSKAPHRLRSPIYQTDEGYERIYYLNAFSMSKNEWIAHS